MNALLPHKPRGHLGLLTSFHGCMISYSIQVPEGMKIWEAGTVNAFYIGLSSSLFYSDFIHLTASTFQLQYTAIVVLLVMVYEVLELRTDEPTEFSSLISVDCEISTTPPCKDSFSLVEALWNTLG